VHHWKNIAEELPSRTVFMTWSSCGGKIYWLSFGIVSDVGSKSNSHRTRRQCSCRGTVHTRHCSCQVQFIRGTVYSILFTRGYCSCGCCSCPLLFTRGAVRTGTVHTGAVHTGGAIWWSLLFCPLDGNLMAQVPWSTVDVHLLFTWTVPMTWLVYGGVISVCHYIGSN
jgi:hypothetical protein